MRFKLTAIGLGTTMVVGLFMPLLPASAAEMTVRPDSQPQIQLSLQAQRPPASTYRPGFWQPVARINPKQAWQLQVVNQSSQPVQYGVPAGANDSLAAGKSATLSNLDLPVDVLIYSSAPNTALKYTVTAAGNTAIVTVQEAAKGTAGNGSVVINQTGAIYIY